MNRVIVIFAAMFLVAGCGNGDVEQADSEAATAANAPDASDRFTTKPQGPVSITYRIIGTPIVGRPVGIDLQVTSTLGPQAISLSYRVNDSTAMQLAEAQPARVAIAPTDDEGPSLQQVQIIPLREGRLFLNVSAAVEMENGTISTVTAIPIQVGAAARQNQQNGVITTDENGEQIRSLPASEN